MSIDKPGGGSDKAPDLPRKPEYPVPRPDDPAARERPASSTGADAPAARQDRGADAEAHRLARLARRAEASPRPEAPREPRAGDKGVITHFHGPTVDLYTDGTRWASGDVIRAREAERERQAGRERAAERPSEPDRKPGPSTDVPAMRDYGRAYLGETPNDAADLPSDRKELLESEDKDRSRTDKAFRVLEDDEVFGDAHDQSVDQGNMWQRVFDGNQPQGHPMQVQRDTPHAAPAQQWHPMIGDALGAAIGFGVMADRTIRFVRNIVTRKKEVD